MSLFTHALSICTRYICIRLLRIANHFTCSRSFLLVVKESYSARNIMHSLKPAHERIHEFRKKESNNLCMYCMQCQMTANVHGECLHTLCSGILSRSDKDSLGEFLFKQQLHCDKTLALIYIFSFNAITIRSRMKSPIVLSSSELCMEWQSQHYYFSVGELAQLSYSHRLRLQDQHHDNVLSAGE